MPRLTAVKDPSEKQTIEFVLSIPLDLMNAMYFTHFAEDHEGAEGWPVEVRKRMAPDLARELDFLYGFPEHQAGAMGTLTDYLWSQPETWKSVDALLAYVRSMPLGIGDLHGDIGVQGLAFNLACNESADEVQKFGAPGRESLIRRLEQSSADIDATLAVWDRPEELRERMANVIERFYNEQYKADLPNRLPCLERSVAAHQGTSAGNVTEVARQLLNRDRTCLDDVCAGPYQKLFFAPSVDMGPYASCAIIGDVHGMFYPCEPRFIYGSDEADATVKMARIYKALGDEQRLRMLDMLRDGEMYVQEIVDRTGLHQSVVSRHLMFLKVVGLLQVRKQNNMKFYSLNPGISRDLKKTLDMFAVRDV
jgi:DNA-binding transcriptional ArsR family regulator